MAAFDPATVFVVVVFVFVSFGWEGGPRWLPSQQMLRGQDGGFWRAVVLGEGQERPPTLAA